MRKTTEELKQALQKVVDTYNEAVKTQQNCKNEIIALDAVIKDRALEDGTTEDTSS
tara:strand:- start:59 stop:226 length:168 start_codon:yes stop_codon:yes gene_type:complete